MEPTDGVELESLLEELSKKVVAGEDTLAVRLVRVSGWSHLAKDGVYFDHWAVSVGPDAYFHFDFTCYGENPREPRKVFFAADLSQNADAIETISERRASPRKTCCTLASG